MINKLFRAWWRITHARTVYLDWLKWRRRPKANQVIYYHDTLVRVIDVDKHNEDELLVRWYDNVGRHEEWASWMHCCRLP